MKKFLLGSVALIALVGTAAAADLPAKAPVYKAPLAVAYNWTGFYVGINGGGGWGTSNWDGIPSSFNTSGGLVGATIGYNWQNGSPLVFGLEGDLDWANIRGT